MENTGKIKVLVKKPGKLPEIKWLDNNLKTLQETVGGYIETVTLENGLLLICNEDGKLQGLPPNIRIGGDVIVGTVIACRSDDEGELIDLTTDGITEMVHLFRRVDVCKIFERDDRRNRQSIGDFIRSMSNRELAELFYAKDMFGYLYPRGFCKSDCECREGDQTDEMCIACAEKWLEEPADVFEL